MKYQLLFSLALLMLPMGHGADAASPEDLRHQADALVAEIRERQPVYGLLSEQQGAYLVTWREQVRQYIAVNGSRNAPSAGRAIAAALALNDSAAYLSRSDDAGVDALLVQQRRLMALAQTDASLCGILLNTPTARLDESGRTPWLLRRPYKTMLPALEMALFQVVGSAQGKMPRTLPDSQSQQFTQRIAAQMGERFGREGLEDLERLQNDNSAPALRCRGVSRLLDTIAQQPPELRTQLMRIYFGQ